MHTHLIQHPFHNITFGTVQFGLPYGLNGVDEAVR